MLKHIAICILVFALVGCQPQPKTEVPKHTQPQATTDSIFVSSNHYEIYTQPQKVQEIKSIWDDPLDYSRYSQYENYADDIFATGQLYRWPKRELYFYVDRAVERRMSVYLVHKALRHWVKYSKIFAFYQVDNPEDADIEIVLNRTGGRDVLGEARPDRVIATGRTYRIANHRLFENHILHATITISADAFSQKRVSKMYRKNKRTTFQTMVHEIGHVLGIMGHSSHQGDCLYYRSDDKGVSCDSILPDTNTLAMIYGKPSALKRGHKRRHHIAYSPSS